MSYRANLINFVLYSNLWIATAAVVMTWQTQLLLFQHFEFSYLTSFVFVATLLLYAVHRLVSLRKLQNFSSQERFFRLQSYQSLLTVIALISVFVAAFLFLQLTDVLKTALLVPILLAAGYALPVLPGKKRLRDLPFLKNILIAGVWIWITVALPALEQERWNEIPIWLVLSERFCFVFAISLAFDIRDMKLDLQTKVRTIPLCIGLRATKMGAIALNSLALVCAARNYWFGYYSLGDWLGISISVLCSSVLIGYAHSEKKDGYYAGWLDGMMILQFLLVWIL